MIKNEPDRKTVVAELAKRFGVCGCKERCEVEQYGLEIGTERKPRGRYSVCELEAEQFGIAVSDRTDA